MHMRARPVATAFALTLAAFAFSGFLVWMAASPAQAQQDGAEASKPGRDIDVFLAGAASDRIDVLLYYLEKGLDPDSRGKAGNTALIVASGAGAGSAVSFLLARNADPNIANEEGWTPLMEAAFRDRLEIVNRLLQAGADPNRIEQRNGYTALHVAARGTDPSVVSALVSAGAEIEAKDRKDGHTALMRALAGRKSEAVEIVAELLVAGARSDGSGADGMSPLMVAVQTGNIRKIGLILDAGPDLMTQSPDGHSALSIAARRGSAQIVQDLLKRGATPDMPNGIAPIAQAAASGSHNSVLALLEAGANPDLPGLGGKTALMTAATIGNGPIVDLLLKRKADPNARSAEDGSTALMWAANAGRIEMVQRLLAAGARISIKAKDGWTAIEAAQMAGHEDIARLLAEQI